MVDMGKEKAKVPPVSDMETPPLVDEAPKICAPEDLPGQAAAVDPLQVPREAALQPGVDGVVAGPAAGLPVVGYKDIFLKFVWMGWIAFGGPTAHIGLFQKVFVERLRWISSSVFLELLALSQCLPGPTSTQVSFALGVVQKGVSGGLLSGTLFQYPGLLISALVGVGAANFLRDPAPWLRGLVAGLAAVGVALVASAAKGLTVGTCKDPVTMVINAIAAVVSFYYPATWIFPLMILAGGLATLAARWRTVDAGQREADHVERLGVSRAIGTLLILAWLVVLVVTIVLARRLPYEGHEALHWWEAFYRTGSIIFGGGQVVLPLLQTEVVPRGWMTNEDFLTGLALVQAMPGPLFNLAAYLGAIIAIRAGQSAAAGIFTCWVGLFAPGIILIYGFMPWWGMFRNFQVYRRMLPGLNAAAVGLIVAAVFALTLQIYHASPFPTATICIGIIGFSIVDFLPVPDAIAIATAPIAIGVGAVLGVVAWATGMH